MRLQLTLNHFRNQVLPINYQYTLASWIYATLWKENEAFATWLHNQGYEREGKKYKLFTFGPLRPKRYRINPKEATFILEEAPTTIQLSFQVDETLQHFVMGLFNQQQFQLKSGKFQGQFEVTSVEMLPRPTFENTMRFRVLTPICISRKEEEREHASYLSPEDKDYGQLLINNLLRKQQALQQQLAGIEPEALEEIPFDFKLLSKPKSKLLNIKGTKVKGYLFDFELNTQTELQEIGYYAGFGEKNSSLGMGMVRVLK